jgi:hypothetical protein
MPRTIGTGNIKAWEAEKLINDLAVGGRPYAELATEYGVADQTIAAFAVRNRADIEAKKRDQSSEYGHIWATKKGNAIRVLTMSLEKCWQQIALPDASEVRPQGNEYRAYLKLSKELEREIMDQTGQLYQRVQVDATVIRNPITDFDTIAIDDDGTFHAVKQ